MGGLKTLCKILKIEGGVKALNKLTKIPIQRLNYYENFKKLPMGNDLKSICDSFQITPEYLKARFGIYDKNVSLYLDKVLALDKSSEYRIEEETVKYKNPTLEFETNLGKLYQGDCLALLHQMESESVDLVFADPPFNLDKFYESKINDNLHIDEYLEWCKEWVAECARVLKFGGSFFIWNLPRWNILIGNYLNSYLNFRHLIAADIKYRLPIAGRLYPSNYSLLYFCKGEKPKTFHPDRLPMEVCPTCKSDLRDYGGYKDKMNPLGISLTDVWYDIQPVRHAKYKRRKESNELPLKLLDRVIQLASDENDLVFDPFGGSGTTYVAAELKRRKWIGIELGPTNTIENRFSELDREKEHLLKIRKNYNQLFTAETLKVRRKHGLWTPQSVREYKEKEQLRLTLSERKSRYK